MFDPIDDDDDTDPIAKRWQWGFRLVSTRVASREDRELTMATYRVSRPRKKLSNDEREQLLQYADCDPRTNDELEDDNAPENMPLVPTSAVPGSPEKIAVLAARVRRREGLWHPLDKVIRSNAE